MARMHIRAANQGAVSPQQIGVYAASGRCILVAAVHASRANLPIAQAIPTAWRFCMNSGVNNQAV